MFEQGYIKVFVLHPTQVVQHFSLQLFGHADKIFKKLGSKLKEGQWMKSLFQQLFKIQKGSDCFTLHFSQCAGILLTMSTSVSTHALVKSLLVYYDLQN